MPNDKSRTIRINNKWDLTIKIGSGSFGDIYLGIDTANGQEVAVKMEGIDASNPQLIFESKVYQYLQKNPIGVPRILYTGLDCTGKYNAMVMELLGPSLEDLFNYCKRQFSLKTVLMLADQMIQRLQTVHSACFIHRDIKPDNFLMGIGKSCNTVYLVDFGLSKRYMEQKTKKHMPYKTNKTLTGTARYASIRAHKGEEQSRRDDLESLGYVWIYFLKGSLPWQGIRGATKNQKYELIASKKESTKLEELCDGLPYEFLDYMTYVKKLSFTTEPEYQTFLRSFKSLFRKLGYVNDYFFDWTLIRHQSKYAGRKLDAPVSFTKTKISVNAP